MIVIGLILLLIVVAVAITLITSGNDPVTVNLFGIGLDASARTLYLTGAASLLLAVIAIWLIRIGARRSRRLRRENRALKRDARAGAEPAAGPDSVTSTDTDVDEQFKTAPRE